jgi:hypothetical protein
MKRILNMVIVVCFAFLPLINCSKASDYERGLLTETSFESKYLDIRFNLPEGFVMATEEDMLQMMGIGTDIAGVNKKIVKLTTVYEMMASAAIGYPNVIVMVEKLLLSNITTEQYFDALKTGLLKVNTMNYEVDDQITSVEIAGYNYKQLSASLPSSNIFQNYIFRKQGSRMIGFINTYSLDTKQELETLMNGFSKLTH